ncbi:hypothetical protein M408DRAFT_278491 [Serendipita vermifera MAFF 305830]|uniref:Uncharacterized protein n=1 Tax=Serendipita vermifera MAFF 305830 TaxID=933852 RepID=A0A0C3ADW1_SERVB|nr:hypothetical protein M408DRAFT_278491 [Serendipita vermifera MAFF 305830]
MCFSNDIKNFQSISFSHSYSHHPLGSFNICDSSKPPRLRHPRLTHENKRCGDPSDGGVPAAQDLGYHPDLVKLLYAWVNRGS